MAEVKCNGKQIKLFNAFCISFMHIVSVLINSNECKTRQKLNTMFYVIPGLPLIYKIWKSETAKFLNWMNWI